MWTVRWMESTRPGVARRDTVGRSSAVLHEYDGCSFDLHGIGDRGLSGHRF